MHIHTPSFKLAVSSTTARACNSVAERQYSSCVQEMRSFSCVCATACSPVCFLLLCQLLLKLHLCLPALAFSLTCTRVETTARGVCQSAIEVISVLSECAAQQSMVAPAPSPMPPVNANQNSQAFGGGHIPGEVAAEVEQGLAAANHAFEGVGGNPGAAATHEAQHKHLGWGNPLATPPRLSEYNTQLHKGSILSHHTQDCW